MSDKSKKSNSTSNTPFWKSRAFIIIAVVCLGGVVYGGMKYFSNNPYAGVPKRAVDEYKLGVEALEKSDPEKALDSFFKAIELDNSFVDALARIAETYFIAAQKHRSQSNSKLYESTLAESSDYLKKALAIDPNNGLAHFVSGLHAHSKNDSDLAIHEFELAESKGTSIFELHSMLGYLYNEKGLTAKCVSQYEKALDLRHDDVKTLYNLSELYYGLENYAKATKYYGELLKYEPNETLYKAKYAASVWKNGDVSNAKTLFNRILESEEGNKYSKYNEVAWILIDKELDIAWGIQVALIANEIKPNNLTSLDILGWGYYKHGEYAKAVDYLNRSMNQSPSDEIKKRLTMAKEKLDESLKK